MLTYPNIDPIAVALGPLQVHWYGLMYLMAFLFALLVAVTICTNLFQQMFDDGTIGNGKVIID